MLAPLIVLLTVASGQAANIVQSFGPEGTDLPQLIILLDTIIGNNTASEPEYREITSSNADIRFVFVLRVCLLAILRADPFGAN